MNAEEEGRREGREEAVSVGVEEGGRIQVT